MAVGYLRRGLLGGLAWCASSCGPELVEQSTDSGSSGGGTTGSTSTSTGTAGSPTTGGTEAASAGTSTGSMTTTVSTTTTGGGGWCNPRSQDCADGEKCVAYASPDSGGLFWDAYRCVPEPQNPAQKGEPCAIDRGESVFSGLDNCAKGTMCLQFDLETGQDGICTAFCGPGYTCEDGEVCPVSRSVPSVCYQTCDPLAQDCPLMQGCYGDSSYPDFVCAKPDPGAETGMDGSPCAFTNACVAGLLCVVGTMLVDCTSDYCCTPYCVVGDNSPCAPGEECLPVFGEDPPPGHEDVGLCVSPE